MKKKLVAFVLLAAVMLNLIACSSTETNVKATEANTEAAPTETVASLDEVLVDSTDKNGESKIVDVVKLAGTDAAADLSPWAGNNSGCVGLVHMFYESLFIQEYKGELEPCLAKSYTRDGNVLTVTLFDYIKDTAGNHFTANDVVFSLDQAIAGGVISYVKILKSYRAVDDYTVELELNDNLAVGDLETFLTNVFYVTKAAFEASPDGMVTDPVGTGHYEVTEFTSGYRLVMEAKEDWWQTDEQYIASRSVANAKRVEAYVMADSTACAIAVETGEVDCAGISYADLQSVKDAGLDVYTYMMSLTRILLCNCSEDSVLNDVNLRKAVYYAIDNSGVAKMISDGVGVPVYDMSSNNYVDYYEDYYKELSKENYYGYNPEKSQQLLSDAGHPNGIELTLITDVSTAGVEIAQAIQAYLGAVGITVHVESYQANMLTSIAEDSTKWDLYLRQTAANGYATVAWSRPFKAANYKSGGTCNFIFDDYLQSQLEYVNTDEGHTEQNVKDLYNYIVDNAYGMGLCTTTSYIATDDKIEKLSFNASIMVSPNSFIYR